MARHCEICGRKLITGRKYCHIHRGYGNLRRNNSDIAILFLIVAAIFILYSLLNWVKQHPIISTIIMFIIFALIYLYTRKRGYLEFILNKNNNYSKFDRYAKFTFYSFILFFTSFFLYTTIDLLGLKILWGIILGACVLILVGSLVMMFLIKFKEWFL